VLARLPRWTLERIAASLPTIDADAAVDRAHAPYDEVGYRPGGGPSRLLRLEPVAEDLAFFDTSIYLGEAMKRLAAGLWRGHRPIRVGDVAHGERTDQKKRTSLAAPAALSAADRLVRVGDVVVRTGAMIAPG